MVTAGQFIGLGWYIATAIITPTLLGLWLDERFSTTPILLLIGLLTGLIVGFYGAYRMTSIFLKSEKNAK
jgi:F0F1-type ATP synthase assembly protein I